MHKYIRLPIWLDSGLNGSPKSHYSALLPLSWIFIFHIIALCSFQLISSWIQLNKRNSIFGLVVSVWPDVGHTPISEPIHHCCQGIQYFSWPGLSSEPPSKQEMGDNYSRTTWMGCRSPPNQIQGCCQQWLKWILGTSKQLYVFTFILLY